MDFGALAPEIHSGRMYAGPGSGPMLAAAAAWEGLADALYSTASSYHSVIREVEELMLVRGVVVSYETIRRWCAKFGQAHANQLRRRRPRPGDKWHLDCDVRSHALSGYVDWRVSRC